ncbi:MAG: low molecular weight protein arginine phosphatase [bacterium]|nr:low molecular weight protein arginine phosphatase [bacterium]
MNYSRLIFVCTGNTSRSPMAKAIYERMDKENHIRVFSRGLVVLFPEPANPKACAVLKNNDLDIEGHVSTALVDTDITENTLILTMTEKQKQTVMEEFENATDVYTIKEFVGMDGDVMDPYGGTLLEYEECFAELSTLVKKTVYRLNEED